jgi:hypothetical protein
MNLMDFLLSIEYGNHDECSHCPWNPKRIKSSAFGVSCVKHGIDWNYQDSAVSVLIAQDPAGTTPEKTGYLCIVCNSQFETDNSARHGFALWKAAVSLAQTGQEAKRYMKGHYWTNAIMHGVKDKQREKARACCKNILNEQLTLLSPRIIIATGKVASESLYDIGLLSKRWDDFKKMFSYQVYSEQTILPSGKKATVYCTYHAAARSVNTHVADLYSDNTRMLLAQRIEKLPDTSSTLYFLRQHQGFTGEDKGMKVLLLHWLEIGDGIRLASTS